MNQIVVKLMIGNSTIVESQAIRGNIKAHRHTKKK